MQSSPQLQSIPGQYNFASQNYNAPLGSSGGSTSYNPVLGASTQSSGGTSSGSTTNNPTPGPGTQLNNNPPAPPSVDPLFQPALDALNASIAPTQQGEQAQEGQINQAAGEQTNQVNTALQGQQQQLGQQQGVQDTSTQNAIAQARQAASEIQQGIQARYGGSTGTGAFASEISGRSAQNNIGQYNQQYMNNTQAISNAKMHAQQLHDAALDDIKTRTQSAIQTAQSALQDRLKQ